MSFFSFLFPLIEATTFIYLKKMSRRDDNNLSKISKKVVRERKTKKEKYVRVEGGKVSNKGSRMHSSFLANWSMTWWAEQGGHDL